MRGIDEEILLGGQGKSKTNLEGSAFILGVSMIALSIIFIILFVRHWFFIGQ